MKKNIEIKMFVDFVKKIESDKVRDHCHSTGKYGGTADSRCNTILTRDQSNFIHLYFTILVNMIVIYFFKR